MSHKKSIAFMGSADFSVPSLAALTKNSEVEVVAVYCQPPKPKGRGHKVQKCPVHIYADENSLPVFHPKSLKTGQAQDEFDSLKLDLAVVAAYGLILPKEILVSPKYGCVNIHASLLPKWRGAAPIQYSLWKGDRVTGITLMQMDEGLDTGDMIAKVSTDISKEDTGRTLHDRLAQMGADLLKNNLTAILSGQTRPIPQNDEDSSYAHKLSRQIGKIDWSKPAEEIHTMIRAFDPWPGTWFELSNGERVKVFSAEVINSSEKKPGELIAYPMIISTGENALSVKTIQKQGRSVQTSDEFIRGNAIPLGTIFG